MPNSMWKFDLDALLEQVKINYEDQYIQWHPSKLKDNIWEVLALTVQVIRQVVENKHIGLTGNIRKVTKDTYRIYYVDKRFERVVDAL